jgi:hypothetical protein
VEPFDLSQDIGEQQDLAAERVSKVKELREKLVQWRAGIEAAMPPAPTRI